MKKNIVMYLLILLLVNAIFSDGIQAEDSIKHEAILNRLNSLEKCLTIYFELGKQIEELSKNSNTEKELEKVILKYKLLSDYLKEEMKTNPSDQDYLKNLDIFMTNNQHNLDHREIVNKTQIVSRSEIETLFNLNLSEHIFNQAKIERNLTNGKPDGVYITNIKKGSLLQKLGFQDGDILNKIITLNKIILLNDENDFPLGDIKKNSPVITFIAIAQLIRNSDFIKLQLRRGDKDIEIEVIQK